MSQKLNKYSSRITGMKSQGASQAMLYGVGLTDADMQKAQVGSPIALVANGDQITIDAVNNTIMVDVGDEELAARRKNWTAPPYKATRGALHKYIKNVTSASQGCVTDE